MNRDETGRLLRARAELYQNAPKPQDLTSMLDAWHMVLAPYDSARMGQALLHYIRRGNAFAPNAGELIAAYSEVAHGALPSYDEAWSAATRRISAEEKMTLHPVLRDVLRRTGGIDTVAWLSERDGRHSVRSAYQGAVNEFRVANDPEMHQAPDHERRLDGPRDLGGSLAPGEDHDDDGQPR